MPSNKAITIACLLITASSLLGCQSAIRDSKTKLVTTQTIPSPKATQAAIADNRYIYAVANEVVVKYDRATGQEVARSTGEAEHLNAGLLQNGIFLLSHSNYPAKPDRSDIKQLDPDTMVLKMWHDFGESDGSLTWIARHDGHWYANFAFYKDKNHKTYLARFDDDWNELERWRYPQAVIDRMDNASISSGVIMDDGTIYGIGHHTPEIYRLRLPADGETLELIDIIDVPIPGQGIAVDPKTGGIVGISRPDRTLLITQWK